MLHTIPYCSMVYTTPHHTVLCGLVHDLPHTPIFHVVAPSKWQTTMALTGRLMVQSIFTPYLNVPCDLVHGFHHTPGFHAVAPSKSHTFHGSDRKVNGKVQPDGNATITTRATGLMPSNIQRKTKTDINIQGHYNSSKAANEF